MECHRDASRKAQKHMTLGASIPANAGPGN